MGSQIRFEPSGSICLFDLPDSPEVPEVLRGHPINISVELIHPEEAQLILTHQNNHNRRTYLAQVNRIKSALVQHDWMFNGATICFDEQYTLIDGQHRLEASVVAMQPLLTLVVWNLPSEVQNTQDLTKPRTVAGQFEKEHIPNATLMAVTTNWLARYYGGTMRRNQYVQTPTEGLRRYHSYIGLQESLPVARKFGQPPLKLSQGMMAFLHYIIRNSDIKRTSNDRMTEEFFGRLLDGAQLSQNDPRYVLREALLNRRRRGAGRTDPTSVAAWVIKAWNAYVQKTEIRQIVYKAKLGEKFPTPV